MTTNYGCSREPRASGYLFLASRIRRELRPELFCGKRWLLAIVEPVGKQHERLTHLRSRPRDAGGACQVHQGRVGPRVRHDRRYQGMAA